MSVQTWLRAWSQSQTKAKRRFRLNAQNFLPKVMPAVNLQIDASAHTVLSIHLPMTAAWFASSVNRSILLTPLSYTDDHKSGELLKSLNIFILLCLHG
jgi:hypothetical protein